MFTRLAINIIRKDWLEHWKLIVLLTAGSFVPLLVPYTSLEFKEGMLAGILVAASYGYAFECFMAERQRGTLQLLLSLPMLLDGFVYGQRAGIVYWRHTGRSADERLHPSSFHYLHGGYRDLGQALGPRDPTLDRLRRYHSRGCISGEVSSVRF